MVIARCLCTFFCFFDCIFFANSCVSMGKRIPSSVPLLLIRGCELSYAPGWIHAVDFFFFFKSAGLFSQWQEFTAV